MSFSDSYFNTGQLTSLRQISLIKEDLNSSSMLSAAGDEPFINICFKTQDCLIYCCLEFD